MRQRAFPVVSTLIIGMILSILSGCSSDNLPNSYQPLPTPINIGEFELYDQNAKVIGNAQLKDTWSLVFFGFTYCPDVCPTTLAELNQVAAKLGDNTPQIVLLSVDPERDTPEQLKSYIEYFNPAFQAWSGEQGQISNLAKTMHIFFDKQPLGDSYTMDHSSQVVLVNPQGQYAGFFPPPLKPDEMVLALNELMK